MTSKGSKMHAAALIIAKLCIWNATHSLPNIFNSITLSFHQLFNRNLQFSIPYHYSPFVNISKFRLPLELPRIANRPPSTKKSQSPSKSDCSAMRPTFVSFFILLIIGNMSKVPIQDKSIALVSEVYMSTTTKFIRTSSAAHQRLSSQSSLPVANSLEKTPHEAAKTPIQRQTVANQLGPKSNENPTLAKQQQFSVKNERESVEDIAMAISASIFMNSTTKFVKGFLSGAQTQRVAADAKKQNQKEVSRPKRTFNTKNPQEALVGPNTDKNVNSTAKIPNIYKAAGQINQSPCPQTSEPPTLSPSKLQPASKQIVPTSSVTTNLSSAKLQAVHKQIEAQEKSSTNVAGLRSSPNRQSSPEAQKYQIFKGGDKTGLKKQGSATERNAYQMAGEQFLSSTTKFVKNLAIPLSNQSASKIEILAKVTPVTKVESLSKVAPLAKVEMIPKIQPAAKEEPATKIEPRKGISPAPNIQTQLSYTPIKSSIGIQSSAQLGKHKNISTQNRLLTNNEVAQSQKGKDNTHRIDRKSTKARDIRFLKKENEEPVSIMNYNSAEKKKGAKEMPRKGIQEAGQEIQTQTKDLTGQVAKPSQVAEKRQSPPKANSPNTLRGNRLQPKFIANFSNNESKVQQNNEGEMAATKKRPFTRQNAKHEQNLLKDTAKFEPKSQTNIEVALGKIQNNRIQINAQTQQTSKSPRYELNMLNAKKPNQMASEVQKKTLRQEVKHLKEGFKEVKQAISPKTEDLKFNKNKSNDAQTIKTEEETLLKIKRNTFKQTKEPILYNAKSKEVKKNETDASKLNSAKSAQNFESVWAKPSQQKRAAEKAVIQTQKQISQPNNQRQISKVTQSTNDITNASNKVIQKEKEPLSLKSVPSMPSIKNIRASTTTANNNISKAHDQFKNQQNLIKAQSKIKMYSNSIKNTNQCSSQVQKKQIISPKNNLPKENSSKNDKQQLNNPNIKRSEVSLYLCSKLIQNRKKQAFATIKNRRYFDQKHRKQAIILIHSINAAISNLFQNYKLFGFQKLKKNLILYTQTKKIVEGHVVNTKQSGVSILFRMIVEKQKGIFQRISQYSWLERQFTVNKAFADKHKAEKVKEAKKIEPNFKTELNNLARILTKFSLEKTRKAFNKLVSIAFTTISKKKLAQLSPIIKQIGQAKSPQKPAKNYIQERKIFLQSKSETQAQIDRIEYRISDKKRFVQFQRGKLIKKMDQLSKTVNRLEGEVITKRKRSQQLQTLIGNLGDTILEIDLPENQPLLQNLAKIYSDLLKSTQPTIHCQTFLQKYKISLSDHHNLVQQWNTLIRNAELKREIGLWQGYEFKEQQMRRKFREEQDLECKVLRGYVKERYLWEWVHVVARCL